MKVADVDARVFGFIQAAYPDTEDLGKAVRLFKLLLGMERFEAAANVLRVGLGPMGTQVTNIHLVGPAKNCLESLEELARNSSKGMAI